MDLEAWPAQSPESQDLAHGLERHGLLCQSLQEWQGCFSLMQLGVRGDGDGDGQGWQWESLLQHTTSPTSYKWGSPVLPCLPALLCLLDTQGRTSFPAHHFDPFWAGVPFNRSH